MSKTATFLASVLVVPLLSMAFGQPKVILDTDFNTLGDDGQVFIMLSQLHAAGDIDLLGVTTVSGNQWVDQEDADLLRSIERMGMESEVNAYSGAPYPLIHDYASYQQEKKTHGVRFGGAWSEPRPASPSDLVAPPDGFADHVELAPQSAVDFLIDQLNAYPGEITILEIGPATNLALAFRQEPAVVAKVGRIIFMGGAIDVPGNVTPKAEFNWWFDPEAVRIAVRNPIDMLVVPLDVTDTVQFNKEQYDRIVSAADTAVTELFKGRFEERFRKTPDYVTDIWDSITVAVMMHPELVTRSEDLSIDVDTTFGPNYGRSLGYRRNPPVDTLHQATIVQRIDNDAFWDFYVDLMTRPVPVQMKE